MALREKDRNKIHTEFRKILGEEATQAMLSQLPSRDVDEPITREHLKDELTTRMLTIASLQLAAVGVFYAIVR